MADANRDKIAGVAAQLISGELDPLTACRLIVELSWGDGVHDDEDVIAIQGIESELDG